jgi:hypothetical protein
MTNMPALSTANSAKRRANRIRSEHLVAVAKGTATAVDVVKSAASDEGKALLRLTLRQLLLAQPGWGEDRCRSTIDKITAVTGTTPDRVTLAWLLDPRAAGRRFFAFCDALHVNNNPPWPGFPHTARPTAASTAGSTP